LAEEMHFHSCSRGIFKKNLGAPAKNTRLPQFRRLRTGTIGFSMAGT